MYDFSGKEVGKDMKGLKSFKPFDTVILLLEI